MFDSKAFAADVIDAVKGYVARETAPLIARAEAAETRAAELETRIAGIEADFAKRVADLEQRAPVPGPQGEPGANGKDGRDGIDGKDGADGANGMDGAPGPAGRDADPDQIKAMVAEAVAALPPAERGEKGEQGDRGERGEPGRDGVGVAGAVIERTGALVLTLSDGTTRDLGVVVGKDGRNGEPGEKGPEGPRGESGADGRDADPVEVAKALHPFIVGEIGAEVAKLPMAKDGKDGAAGKDGVGIADALINNDGALVLALTDGTTKCLGVVKGEDGKPGDTFALDDFDIVPYGDGRTFKFCFTKGEAMHSFEFAFPVPLDKGVYREGESYERGDIVTYGGSLWIAQRDTKDKPETTDAWRLAVKRGRDGKNG